MKCVHCQGELQRGLATFTDSRNGYVLVLNDLPAWVCQQCGEPLYEAVTVDGIQQALRALDEQMTRLRPAA
jgi:YgiT-type zinc finger domain-containing protein